MKNKPRLILLIPAVLLGMAFGFSLSNLAFSPGLPPATRIFGWLVFSIATAIAVYFTLANLIYPRLKPYRQSYRIKWVAFCILAGFGLVITIPWTRFPKESEIKIIATGEKNSLAEGSEVWLVSITNGLKTEFPGWRNLCQGDWMPKDGMLVSSNNQPSRLVCQVSWDGQIVVRLATHRWSGIAQVVYADSQIERVSVFRRGRPD